MPLLLLLLGCSDFARNRDRYDTAAADARIALAQSNASLAPGCPARTASLRTPWAHLPRGQPTDPNVLALGFPDGAFIAVITTEDRHGYRSAYASTDPPQTPQALGAALDQCGGSTWESVTPLDSGWYHLISRLD